GEAEAIGGRLSPEDVQWLAQYTPLHPNEQYHWDWEELPRTKISVANLYHKEVIWMNPRNRTAKLSLRGVRWPESLTAAFTMRLVLKLEYPQFDGTNTTDASRELCYCFEMSPLKVPLLSPEWIPSVTTARSICSSFADSFVNWEITKEPSDGANVTVVEDGVRVDDDGAYEITIVANGSFLTSIDSRLLTPRSTRTIGAKTLAQYRTKLTKDSVVRVLMVEANDDESSPACATFARSLRQACDLIDVDRWACILHHLSCILSSLALPLMISIQRCQLSRVIIIIITIVTVSNRVLCFERSIHAGRPATHMRIGH
ncbi:hypothetical protein PINS_up020396, partial [Pythium insidiosum]